MDVFKYSRFTGLTFWNLKNTIENISPKKMVDNWPSPGYHVGAKEMILTHGEYSASFQLVDENTSAFG